MGLKGTSVSPFSPGNTPLSHNELARPSCPRGGQAKMLRAGLLRKGEQGAWPKEELSGLGLGSELKVTANS